MSKKPSQSKVRADLPVNVNGTLVFADTEITVDLVKFYELLAKKAYHNKTKRARFLDGIIKVRIHEKAE